MDETDYVFIQRLGLSRVCPVFKYLVDDFTTQIADMDFVLVSVSLKTKHVFVYGLDHSVKLGNGLRTTVNNKAKLAVRPDARTVGRDGVPLPPRKIDGVFKSFAGVPH